MSAISEQVEIETFPEIDTKFHEVCYEGGMFQEMCEQMLSSSLIVTILGGRGSGKTSCGFALLEEIGNKTSRPCYVLDYPDVALPGWIKKLSKLEINSLKRGAVVLVDETSTKFSSRSLQTNSGKEIISLMCTARHKEISLIFISQNSSFIDVNIMALVDAILIKTPSLMQVELERKGVSKILSRARKKLEIHGRGKSHFYVFSDFYIGVASHDLPSFWGDDISKSFGKDKNEDNAPRSFWERLKKKESVKGQLNSLAKQFMPVVRRKRKKGFMSVVRRKRKKR